MCLRFLFLLTTRLAAWLGLSRREEAWKTTEILILRHQLAVLQRRQPRRPKLNWADRALLAALPGVIPKARRHGLRLLVTPDTILRWHRDIVRRRQAARSMRGRTGRPPAGTSGPWPSGWPRRAPNGATAGSTGSWPAWECESRRRPYGRSSRTPAPAPRFGGPGRPGRSSCAPRPTRSWPATSSRRNCSTAPRPGRDRARDPAHPHPRSHPAPHRGMDHAAGTQPAHGPRRANAASQVHDPRPRLELHRRVRRGPGRRRDPDRAAQRADAPHERDRRTLDRGMPPRAPGPHPGVEPGSSAADPARVRDPPQPASAAPLPARRRAAEAAARPGRSRPVPRPKTHSRRWPDQRISPGRMTLDEVFGTHSVKTDLQSHNMTVRLASAPLDTGNAEKRLSKRGITIRRAPSDDADWLRDELVGIWKPSWLAEVDAAVRGVHSQLFFAVQESRCVGFCAYGINRPHEVGPLGTHPSLRRMGIGSVLIKRCLDEQSREGSGCGRPSAASTGSAPVNAYIRTTAPSLVRPATTTPPPAVSPI